MKSKFNLSQIFKAAWTLVKSTAVSISEALKAAWAKAKSAGLTMEELAVKLGGKVWEKSGMKRIYLNNVGYNTKKMSTTVYVYEQDNTFKVACFIDCPSQTYAWIAKEKQSCIDYVTEKIAELV